MPKYLFPLICIFIPIISWLIYFYSKLYINFSFITPKPISLTLVLLISPIIEEIIFRGILLDFLIKKINNNIIIYAILNIFFVSLHYHNNSNLLYLFLLFCCGIIFTIVKLKYNKIIYPIFLHIYYNTFFILFIKQFII